ncbi:MAG: universal stress protein [Actinomycetia bacterium]|nr:universal stress protein [Actinomycetes bacterium]
MDRFRNILIAASPGLLDPQTLRSAVKLAEANDARLTLIDVVAPLPKWRKTVNVEGRVIDVEAALLKDREERLRVLVENTQARADTETIVMAGEPFIEVIRRVLTGQHDLVMVGEPAPDKPHVPQLSSGVMHLLRKCPVPVWVVRSPQADNNRVLALVDPDPGDPVRHGLNDLVLELATSLAFREGAELHIAHALSLAGEATLRSSPHVQLPGSVVDVMVSGAETTRNRQLNALTLRHVSEGDRTIHMLSGARGDVLPRLADRLDVGVVVMGTVGRTGLRGLIMGNTAETILRAVRCSVLAVRPEGFATPVKIR